MRSKRKVKRDTWRDWNAGMRANLHKPAFVQVWDEVKAAAPVTFSFLERLEKDGFAIDPVKWV